MLIIGYHCGYLLSEDSSVTKSTLIGRYSCIARTELHMVLEERLVPLIGRATTALLRLKFILNCIFAEMDFDRHTDPFFACKLLGLRSGNIVMENHQATPFTLSRPDIHSNDSKLNLPIIAESLGSSVTKTRVNDFGNDPASPSRKLILQLNVDSSKPKPAEDEIGQSSTNEVRS